MSRNIRVFLILSAYLILVKLLVMGSPELFRSTAQTAVFGWPYLAIWIVCGIIGALLSEGTGFPEAWSMKSNVSRIVVPTIVGIGLGILAILTDKGTGWTHYVAEKLKLNSIHIPFPASAIIYPGGAIIVNIIYRLLPVPLLLWLISEKLLKGRGRSTTFWILAVLTSLIEPFGDLGLWSFGAWTTVFTFAEDFALNFTEAVFFKKYGFLAMILLRVQFYFVWHVLWGALQ